MLATFSSTVLHEKGALEEAKHLLRRPDFFPSMPSLAWLATEKSQHGLPAVTTLVVGGRR